MNVFVLNTGRCGSVTFIRACGHITNFTSGHETRVSMVGPERLAYPPDHIEADNRLSWFLGRLDREYGEDAFYVHLLRDQEAVARSFTKRTGNPESIIRAYRQGVYLRVPEEVDALQLSRDYCRTANMNITHFLRDKPRKMTFTLERGIEDFKEFWNAIGAQGDLEAALNEFKTAHNASQNGGGAAAALNKLKRVVKKLPSFLREA